MRTITITDEGGEQMQLLGEEIANYIQVAGIQGDKGHETPGTAVIQAYLTLFIRMIMVVPMMRALEARSWLLIPNSGQMVEILPV